MSEDHSAPAPGDGQSNQSKSDPHAIIDWQAASDLLGGDREFHYVLLESAISEISDLKPKLREALNAQDGPKAHRLAHTMKGAARAVAAVRTTQAAAAVEQAASEGAFTQAINLLPHLDRSIQELGQEIAKNRDPS